MALCCRRRGRAEGVALKKNLVRGVLIVAVIALLAGCAKDAPQDALDPAGPLARQADRLWDLVFAIAVVIFVLVEGALLFALFKFRRKPGREAAQFHGNKTVEVVLTAVPAMILAFIAVPTVSTILDQSREPEGALPVTVNARQFWFRFQYPDYNVVTANELHIPVQTPVRLTLEGMQDDVIHSFWVPRLAGKQDVVPGRETHLLLEADEPGTYLGQCAELCGIGHGYMRVRVVAQTQADFDRWVADQRLRAREPESDEEKAGAEVFAQTCTACHQIYEGGSKVDDSSLQGPNLTHFASRKTFAGSLFDLDEANLADWLRDPPAVKPGSKMPDYELSEEQIDQLVAYLMSLE